MSKCTSKKTLLGFSPPAVIEYISLLEKQLYERKEAVQKLEHTVRILKFEKEDLEQKLRIANEISQYRVQGQITEI